MGKTALHTRFFRDEFSLPYISTIGVEFGIKTIEMCGQRIKLQGITLSPSACAECILSLFFTELGWHHSVGHGWPGTFP